MYIFWKVLNVISYKSISGLLKMSMHKSELMFLHKIREKETTLMSEQKCKLDQSMVRLYYLLKVDSYL